MTRWRLTIEYDGGPFMGWQRQDHGPSVQQSLEEAIHRMTGELAAVHAAGRTDAGDDEKAVGPEFPCRRHFMPGGESSWEEYDYFRMHPERVKSIVLMPGNAMNRPPDEPATGPPHGRATRPRCG